MKEKENIRIGQLLLEISIFLIAVVVPVSSLIILYNYNKTATTILGSLYMFALVYIILHALISQEI